MDHSLKVSAQSDENFQSQSSIVWCLQFLPRPTFVLSTFFAGQYFVPFTRSQFCTFARSQFRTFLPGANFVLFRPEPISYFFARSQFRTFSPGANFVLFRPEPISYFFARTFARTSPALRPEFSYANSYTFVSYTQIPCPGEISLDQPSYFSPDQSFYFFSPDQISYFFARSQSRTFSPGANFVLSLGVYFVLFRPEPISYFFAWSQFCTFCQPTFVL